MKVAYFLTEPQGKKLLSALEIMQEVGIAYMLAHGMENSLCQKGLIAQIPTKK